MKVASFLVFLVTLGLFISCATQSMDGDMGLRPLNPDEQIIGNVRVVFTAPGDSTRRSLNNISYSMLLRAVFDADFPFGADVRNITWSRISGSMWGRAEFVAYGIVVIRDR